METGYELVYLGNGQVDFVKGVEEVEENNEQYV